LASFSSVSAAAFQRRYDLPSTVRSASCSNLERPINSRVRARLFESACKELKKAVVERTHSRRQTLLSQYTKMFGHHRLSEDNILIFLQNEKTRAPLRGPGQHLLPSSVATTTKHWISLFKEQTKEDPKVLRTYLQSLRRQGSEIPQKQAVPATYDQVYKTLPRVSHNQEVTNMVQTSFKVMSRVSEVSKLRGRNLLVDRPQRRIAFIWLQTTKKGLDRPFAHQNLTVAAFRPLQERLFQFLASRAARKNERVFTMGPAKLYRELKKLPPPLNAWSDHSPKAGAVTHLLQLAAQGVIPSHLVPSIPTMAKHAHQVPVLPDTTVRYGRDMMATAMLNNTVHLAIHL
jgi:hypothetical protein